MRAKEWLLVLDNFEQVLGAAPLVTDLLAACPKLKVLVTSRATLRLSGEHELAMQPLALPAIDQPTAIDELSKIAAVALFVARAQAARSDFALTPDNASAIAEICRRLDGLPLALELAAARIKFLLPTALLTRLQRPLPLLTGDPRDVPERLQTMRDAIAWSYDLLTQDEQTLFRHLSVLVGGGTLDAIEGMRDEQERAGGHSVRIPRPSSLDLVASLVDKSLLRQMDGPEGEPRFSMLETIREFGMDRLAAEGEEEWVRQSHAVAVLAFAERAAPELVGPRQVVWLARLEAEHHNLLAARA